MSTPSSPPVDPNAPAYPHEILTPAPFGYDHDHRYTIKGGLTIRERFVMAAMQGLCADRLRYAPSIAFDAVVIDDATLAALNAAS